MLNASISRRSFALAAAASALLEGCGGSSNDFPSIVTAEVQDRGPIFRRLSITLSGAAGVDVDYWTGGLPRLRMRSDGSPTTIHDIGLPRLRAGSTYSIEVRTRMGEEQGPLAWSGNFQTEALPDDIRAMVFAATGTPSQPLMFLAVRATFTGGVVIDADGQVVWYGRTSIAPQGATRRANGNWVIELNGVGLAEFSPFGEQVRLLAQARLPAGTQIHHGVTVTPRDTLLFLAFEPRTFGSRTLNGEAIWEWNPQDDSLVKRWSAFDVLDPLVDLGSRSVPADWFHANSIAMGQHGNIIVSFHFLDQIISIAPDFSALEWRLGGPGSTFTITADQATSGQHSAREIAPNEILLFDNGFARADGGKYSRALQLKLDPVARVVGTTWQYRPSPDIWATVISSVRRLGNGNSVLTFGTPPGLNGATGPISVHEVTAAGALRWQVLATLPAGSTIFQGDPMASLGGEIEVA